RDAAQARLLAVWQRLAVEFGGDPTVAGYDLFNEPSFAEQAPMTSGMLLGRYHALAIRAIRAGEQQAAGGYAHPIFLEPSIWWSGFGVDPLPPRGFTDDPQVVFAPHLYNESITMDQSLGQTFVGIERGFALAARAARGWGSPLWIGEWGSFREPEANRAYYDRFLAAADRRRVGGAVWVWKQGCGDPHVYPSTEAGNIRRIACPSGAPLPSRPAELAPLQRAYPRSVPGRLTELRSDGRTLVLAGDTTGAGPVAGGAPSACTLDVWVPGTAEPRVGASVGVSRLRVVSVPEGSPQQAPSGGWRLVGCATGTYQLRLS
ncbi:MAG TPA: cellulase family glycosylhydrolase, partial [Candidatus Nanopelagicales bacterium]